LYCRVKAGHESLDLIRKLQIYKESNKISRTFEDRADRDVPEKLGGKVCSNFQGSCVVIENTYPLSYIHGGYRLEDLLSVDTSLLGKINHEAANRQIDDFLFLDTETTGLGGAGTVAFLVGTGFFRQDSFVIRQYFMRDYDEEPAVLEDLNSLLGEFGGLVTFNGKSFDWNLIESRFIFNRMKMNLKNPVHLDLLYPARKIWRLKLESCRLVSLEENILGEYRVNDIPGEQIPGVYFKFLNDGDVTDILRVIEHNRLDIISMVSLLAKILSIVENPVNQTDGLAELLGVARIFESCEEKEMVIRCYEECMKNDNGFYGETAAKKLGGMHKRDKDYEKAVECWEYVLNSKGGHRISALIELAKYYEHKARDYEKALETVQKALDICFESVYRNDRIFEDLRKRTVRLKNKIERAKNA
jgi:uncharacterized protein YprB with RNaseH-like and TPR domain